MVKCFNEGCEKEAVNKFCSRSCAAVHNNKIKWSSEEFRKLHSESVTKSYNQDLLNRRREDAIRQWNNYYNDHPEENISRQEKIEYELFSKRLENDSSLENFKDLLRRNPSSLELKVIKYLIENNIEFKFQFIIPCVRYIYDFYVPSLNLILEVDGSYWHKHCEENDKLKSVSAIKFGYKFSRLIDEQVNDEILNLLIKENKFLINSLDIETYSNDIKIVQNTIDLELELLRNFNKIPVPKANNLKNHWKYRHDITIQKILDNVKDKPTYSQLIERLNFSRNGLIRACREFFNLSLEEFSQIYLNTNENQIKENN